MLENNQGFYISESGLNKYIQDQLEMSNNFFEAENSVHHINNKQKLNRKHSHSQKQSSALKNKK